MIYEAVQLAEDRLVCLPCAAVALDLTHLLEKV